MGFNTSQQAYSQAVGTAPTNGIWIDVRNPTTADVGNPWPLGQLWLNNTTSSLYFLNSFTSTTGYVQAIWELLANSANVAITYTNVTFAMSPYTVLVTDEYLSVDSSGGAVTLNFPNSPVAYQAWVVKDRTGFASTNNITLSTPGGSVTFDGQTNYAIRSNYAAVNILANATPTYEIN
jgi:hypothetical protein